MFMEGIMLKRLLELPPVDEDFAELGDEAKTYSPST